MNNQDYSYLILKIDPEYGDIHISEARYWVKNPVTGEKETILNQMNPNNPIYCPNCKAQGFWKMTLTEKYIIISCKTCQKHSWCEKRR